MFWNRNKEEKEEEKVIARTVTPSPEIWKESRTTDIVLKQEHLDMLANGENVQITTIIKIGGVMQAELTVITNLILEDDTHEYRPPPSIS